MLAINNAKRSSQVSVWLPTKASPHRLPEGLAHHGGLLCGGGERVLVTMVDLLGGDDVPMTQQPKRSRHTCPCLQIHRCHLRDAPCHGQRWKGERLRDAFTRQRRALCGGPRALRGVLPCPSPPVPTRAGRDPVLSALGTEQDCTAPSVRALPGTGGPARVVTQGVPGRTDLQSRRVGGQTGTGAQAWTLGGE